MQQFLSFWNTYNVTIIEVLIAIIILTVAFLVYTIFFGKKDEGIADAAQIEKTLQRILEAQSARAAAPEATGDGAAPASVSAGSSEGGSTSDEEVTQLRASLQEKETQIAQLKASVDSAAAAAVAQAASAGAAPAGSADDRSALEARIKELEGNLAEYEIISEDIADLSRYKEENARLLKQLSEAGAAAPAVEAVAEPIPETIPEPIIPEAVPEIVPEPIFAEPDSLTEPVVPEPLPDPVPEAPAATLETAPEAEPAPAPAAAAAEEPNLIDDDLMKEFAAAVEGQKNAGGVSNETDKLMNDFENFMKKG